MKGLTSMNTMVRKPTWVLTQEGNPDRKVMIVTKDGDRSVLPLEIVVRACKSVEKFMEYKRQFEDVLDRLAQWLAEHGSEVERAYVSPEPGGLMFAVIRKGRAFDPAFEEALSDIDLEIARDRDFNLIKLRAIALPESSEETISSFLDISHALMTRVD